MPRAPRHAPSVSRRLFLKQSLVAGGALAFPWVLRARAVAPSNRITLGVIGIGPRCRLVLGSMLEETDVQCVAICDVQADRRAIGKKMVDDKYGNTDCVTIRDFRELLARRDIYAVLIATGDHWHALASIMTAKAGKDIYSEKPCAMTMADCEAIEETMKRYGRVFQAGTQRRSIGNFQLAVQLARTGKLGRLHTLRASIYRPNTRHDWLPAEPLPPRDEVDWDIWLGPCPERPYNREYVTGGWRGHYDFDSGGSILDWGAHTADLCQWANDADDTTPIEYEPSADFITARYANGVKLVFEYHDRPFDKTPSSSIARLGTCPVRFEGDEGWVETGDNGNIEASPASLKRDLRQLGQQRAGTDAGSHARNFFDCIKSRAITNANPHVMRQTHVACHAAAIALELNLKVAFNPAKEEFLNDPEANRLRSRAKREPYTI